MPVTIQDIEKFISSTMGEAITGVTTEHSFRPFFKTLFEKYDNIHAINEPERSEYGAPDFVFLNRDDIDIIRGYAEMKDLDEDLGKIEDSEQMERYKGYDNIILTNNFDWRFFRNGEKYFEIEIGEYDKKERKVSKLYPERYAQLVDEINAFFELKPESITSGARLAEIMGGKARRIRDWVSAIMDEKTDQKIAKRDEDIEAVYSTMKQLLVTDLKKGAFADMYAQTLVYGLFVARYSDTTPEDFSRSEARDLVPKTNPFLREFFDHIAGSSFNKTLSYIVDELCQIFSVSDIRGIVHRQLGITNDEKSEEKDPIIHFYENFLAAYDSKLRKKMGAYYTPTPVVRYIVRRVDEALKNDFGFADGIASNEKVKYTHKVDPYQSGKTARSRMLTERTDSIPAVQILDPAVGTATFLNETVRYIYKEKFETQKGVWNSYVNSNLLPRLNGFELMMTPYTIAHLKLGMTLGELGAKELRSRLHVYLTNTLTEGVESDLPLFALLGLTKAVAEESKLAAEVKNTLPVMIVMGNPPYSGESSNKTKFANSLVDKYKTEPGGRIKLQEKNPKWLNDDYVKFMAFAEDMVQKNGKGIMAMITNNGYLDNPTFRGMRWHLMKTFDKIYVLNLHGNAKKKETCPDGSPDQNVFDIMQGVGIIIAIKTSKNEKLAKVYHSEIYGSRKFKFDRLNSDGPKFKTIKIDERMCYFVPKNTEGKAEYDRGIPINELMPVNSVGIVTGSDSVLVNENDDDLMKNVEEARLNGKGKIPDRLRKTKLDRQNICDLVYRPFDKRKLYYDKNVVERPRYDVMKNMVDYGDDTTLSDLYEETNGRRKNYALIFKRGLNQDGSTPIFVVDCISESRAWSRPGMQGIESAAPLYLREKAKSLINTGSAQSIEHDMWANLNQEFYYANYDEKGLCELFSDIKEPTGKPNSVSPKDIMDYIYASLHSPSYIEKYKEFLKTDFPRIPRPRSWKEFWRLAELGSKLCELHLMYGGIKARVGFPVEDSNIVEKPVFQDGRVWINDNQYFDHVSELAWNFFIGGYQPAQKWLKDRKGRTLSYDDIVHYEEIIAILEETDRIQKLIG